MQIIKLDLSCYDVPQTIVAKQGDVGRKFQARLTDSNKEFVIPNGAKLSVWYSGTSGAGNYTMIGDKSAFTVDGSAVTVELIAQMLMNKGGGTLCLILNGADGTQIAMWNIPYTVEGVPGIDSSEAKAYYTAFSKAAADANRSAQIAQDAAKEVQGALATKLNVGLYSRDTVWVDSKAEQPTKKFWEYVFDAYDSMAERTVEYMHVVVLHGYRLDENENVVDANEPDGGGYRVTISKSSDAYGFVEVATYYRNKFGDPYTFTRVKYNGEWFDVVNSKAVIYENTTGKLLWKNESLGTLWYQDSIPLPQEANSYDTLIVLVALNTSIYYTIPVFIKTQGNSRSGVAYFPTGECGSHTWKPHWRTFFYTNDGEQPILTMSKGYHDGTVSPSRCVPYKIYGCNIAKNTDEVMK